MPTPSKDTTKSRLSHNQFLIVMVMLAVVVWVVALIVSRAIIKTISFNNRLINKKQEVEQTLDTNLATVESLKAGYQELETLGPRPQVIVQALPTTLDIPAIVSKLEALINASGLSFTTFSLESSSEGTGDPAGVSEPTTVASTGQNQEYIYTVGTQGAYQSVLKMIKNFEREISPTRLIELEIQGTQKTATATLRVKGFYQSALTTRYTKEQFK